MKATIRKLIDAAPAKRQTGVKKKTKSWKAITCSDCGKKARVEFGSKHLLCPKCYPMFLRTLNMRRCGEQREKKKEREFVTENEINLVFIENSRKPACPALAKTFNH